MFVIIKEAATGNVGVPRNFAKFTGKHLCQSLFLNKVADLNFIKKRLKHRWFPANFLKFLKTCFQQNTSGRLLLISGSEFHFDEKKQLSIRVLSHVSILYALKTSCFFRRYKIGTLARNGLRNKQP